MDAPDVVPAPIAEGVRRFWGPVTLRCVWELLVQGVRIRPAELREVREHALSLLPPHADLAEAEAVASLAARDWLARHKGIYAPWVRDPDLDILPTPRWREAIHDPADSVHDAVFRLHYADGLPLDEVGRRLRTDAPLLKGAREAVREMARHTVAEDGVSLDGWDPARVDRLIARIATAAGDQCPGPGGLATELGRAHAESCPRCSRALRLFREGLLSPSDLFPPEDARPRLVDLTVVQVHPEGRRHMREVATTLGEVVRTGDLFVAPGPAAERLAALAEMGAPVAGHLRVVRRTVRGSWGRKVVTGPGILELLDEVGRLGWGETRGLAPLPPPAPAPPSAARWWLGAAVLALMAILAALVALSPARPVAEVGLSASASPEGLVFDTPEDAYVDVLAGSSGRLSVVFHSSRSADKGDLATGDGRYAWSGYAERYVVLAGARPFADLEAVAATLSGERGADLAGRLRDRYPGAAIAVVDGPGR